MTCPKCGGQMAATEERGVNYDRCSSCRSLWFDMYALTTWLEKRLPAHHVGEVDELMVPFDSETTDLPCPCCQTRLMRQTHDTITLEWCRACRGLLLDEGEPKVIAAWRQANFSGQMKEVAKDTAKGAGDFAVNFTLGMVLADALDALFGGFLGSKTK